MRVQGIILEIFDVQEGTSSSGSTWKKTNFLVDNGEKYNNLFYFEIFKAEKVDNFIKYNKVGDSVAVEFNVNTKEYQGKYYTSLSAWRVEALKGEASSDTGQEFEGVENDDLPF
jgi:hypothetical protein